MLADVAVAPGATEPKKTPLGISHAPADFGVKSGAVTLTMKQTFSHLTSPAAIDELETFCALDDFDFNSANDGMLNEIVERSPPDFDVHELKMRRYKITRKKRIATHRLMK